MQLLLLDSNSLLNRAYYAMPNLTDRKGMHTGAIFGYMNMLIKVIDEYSPTHVIAVFDRKAPVFRKEIYEGYKAQRKPMPPELAEQMEPLKDIIRAMEIPVVEMDGYEADDLIGSLSVRMDCPAYIVTGDRDSLQLVSDKVNVLLTKKGVSEVEKYTPERLKEDGLTPSQVIDLKSLMGDASDNIPGVAGVGEKTAKDLLASYGTLDGVYGHIDEIGGKLHDKLVQGRDSAYMSYKLATIKCDIDVPVTADEALLKMPFKAQVKDKLLELGLIRIADRLPVADSKEEDKSLPDDQIVEIGNYGQLEDYIASLRKAGEFSFSLGEDVTFATDATHGAKVSVNASLFDDSVEFSEMLARLKPLLESAEVKKTVYDAKSAMHKLAQYGIELDGVKDDAMLLAYLDDANRNYKSLADALMSYGIRKDCEACGIYALCDEAGRGVKDKGMDGIYRDMELPLVRVLYAMEVRGFRVDRQGLSELNTEFEQVISDLTKEIYDKAGEPFNINSTAQLGRILFEKLGLKGKKKNKRGYSTDVEVLTELQDEHPVIPLILRYREISKLRSTYVYGMMPLIDSGDRLHTVFRQTATSTGRLSSTEPNLQNIPVRKKEGALIRKMFIASEGNVLVTADYSQIELRLMAHFSGDKAMLEAFNEGKDIHSATASKVFGVPIEDVTPEMRRQAKAVNFGIIYGISEFGLARDLGIYRSQAREFMQGYFATYPAVKEYMNFAIEQAKQTGYAVTLFGRRREVPELHASNAVQRGFGERVALNMPLQGTASDIIKIAMLKVYEALKQGGYKSALIMQVHDELIVDAVPEEAEEVGRILKECMENAVSLRVKLVAEVGKGRNWLEAK